MNVQEALARLKQARAYEHAATNYQYCGLDPLRRDEYREKDKAYKDAVDRLERETQQLAHTAAVAAARLQANATLVRKLQESRAALETEKRKGQVSEQFRKQRDKRWGSSYTKRVHDALQAYDAPEFSGEPRTGCVNDALDLLRDYHNTMHLAYEQRDEARDTVTQLRAELAHARRQRRQLLGHPAAHSQPSANPFTVAGMPDGLTDSLSADLAAAQKTSAQCATEALAGWFSPPPKSPISTASVEARTELANALNRWKNTPGSPAWGVAHCVAELIDAKLKEPK